MAESKLINLTGLWKNKSKDGTDYLSGRLSPRVNILIFKNSKKRPDSKDPDYTVCLAPNEPKDEKEPGSDEESPF